MTWLDGVVAGWFAIGAFRVSRLLPDMIALARSRGQSTEFAPHFIACLIAAAIWPLTTMGGRSDG